MYVTGFNILKAFSIQVRLHINGPGFEKQYYHKIIYAIQLGLNVFKTNLKSGLMFVLMMLLTSRCHMYTCRIYKPIYTVNNLFN